MKTVYMLTQMVRADLLERTRRHSFLITLGLMICLAYAYVPARTAGYITLSVAGARGVYNAAWVGSLVAILTALLMPLVGFYLVKNAIARDIATGVGQIIATTPLRRLLYTVGKWLSNLTVLVVMVGVTAVATTVLQFALGEDRRLDLVALWSPMVWMVLPTLALVAALALLFETIGWLRGGLGNVIYFFLATALIMGSFLPVMMSVGDLNVAPPFLDVLGIGRPLAAMLQDTSTAFPTLDAGNNSIGPIPTAVAGPLQTFVWAGMAWTLPIIGARLGWVGVGFGIALLAALCFNRFDPSHERRRRMQNEELKIENKPPTEQKSFPASVRLTPLRARSAQFSIFNSQFAWVLLAEVRLLLSDLRWWWYGVLAAFILAGLFVPTDVARQYILPATWLWPILAWSALGAREAQHHTTQLVFSAAHPLGRQLPAAWLAGVLVAALAGSGVAINLLQTGDSLGVLAWSVAAVFIPTLALALATWSGSGKLFEVIYMVLWYFGPLQQIVPQFDFMGVSDSARAAGMPLVYLVVTVALLGIAIVGRRRRLQR
jgi:hypothetical protein